MSRWDLLTIGSDLWSVPKSRGTTPGTRTDTSGPLQRLELVPLVLKTDRCKVLVSMNEVQSLDHTD